MKKLSLHKETILRLTDNRLHQVRAAGTDVQSEATMDWTCQNCPVPGTVGPESLYTCGGVPTTTTQVSVANPQCAEAPYCR